ncbi:MAG: porin [Pseudomonadota bacterium]
MKKSLIAIAALAAAGAVSAQSSVTVFGVVDTGFQRVQSDGAAGDVKTSRLASGLQRTSRLGFRGVEDLGGGLKANFWLEAGIASDSGASASTAVFTNNQPTGNTVPSGALSFNRRATVGLSGNWGEIRLGRDSVVGLLTQESFDPFDANGVGSQRQVVYANAITGGSNVTGFGSVRASNMINYFSPNIAGFNGAVGYALNENPSNAGATEDNGRLFTYRLGYANGPIDIKLGGTKIEFNTGDFQEITLGGSYDFGIVKVGLAAHRNEVKAPANVKTNVTMAYLTAPVGPGLVRVAYTKADEKSAGNNDGNIFAIGYVYNLSKRTSVYTTFATSKNKNGSARYTVGSATATVANGKTQGFDLGLSHAF